MSRAGLLLICGTALVAPVAGASSVPTTTTVSDHYNISYSVSVTEGGRDPHGHKDAAGDSVWSLTEKWSASWDNYLINIDRTNGKVFLIGSGEVGPGTTGTLLASQSFSYKDPSDIKRPISCKGEVATHRYTTNLAISFDGPDNFQTASGGTKPFVDAIALVDHGKCRPHMGNDQNSQPVTFNITLPDGITLEPADQLLSLDWTLPASSTHQSPAAQAKLFPFSELSAGRSFTLKSGTLRRSAPDGHGGTATITEAVEVKFQFLSKKNAG
jgi:hypothetical protein